MATSEDGEAMITSVFFILIAVALLVLVLRDTSPTSNRIEAFIAKKQPVKQEQESKSIIIGFADSDKKKLKQKLMDAGYYNKYLPKVYMPAKIIIGFTIMMLVYVLLDVNLLEKFVAAVLCLVGFIIIPDFILELLKRYRVRRISNNLPYLLDMMSVCVQTGMTIEACFTYLQSELEIFDKHLCYQVKKTADASKVHGIERALNEMSERLPSPEVRSFVLTIIQNLHYGTSVANILSDLAEDMRRIHLLRVEEKVGKLAAKMSVPLILLIMFPIVILILAPGVEQLDYGSVGGSK